MMLAEETLDQHIAEDLLGEEFCPHWHRFTTEPEHAERLANWLVERDIFPEISGTTVTLRHARTRLFAVNGITTMVALAKAVVRLLNDRPDLVGR